MSAVVPLAVSATRPKANVEGEAAWLGAVLMENALARTAGAGLEPHHFFEPVHERLYERILTLVDAGERVTPVTLRPYFEGDEGLRALGGLPYLARLTSDGQGLLAPREIAEQLIALAKHREVIETLRAALEACNEPDANLAEIAERVACVARDAAPSPTAYPFLTLDELGSMPAPDWLVHNLIGQDSLGFVFGAPGSFKSFIVADLGLRLAYGLDWHGTKTKPTGVLYVAGEGARGMRPRTMGWRLSNDLIGKSAPFVVVPTAAQILDPTGRRMLIETIDRAKSEIGLEIGLTIIDTVSRAIPGADESSAETMSAFVSACDEIRAHTGGTVLGVHHAGKDRDKGMRGSTVLLGAADFVIRAEREGDTVTLTVEKQKEAEEAGPFHFVMETVEWDEGNASDPGERSSTRLPVQVERDATDDVSGGSKRKLTGHNKIAYRAIDELIASSGQPPAGEIPNDVLDRSKVTRVISAGQAADKLENEFLGVVNADPDKKADTARRTARRTIGSLKAAEILGTWGDWLWLN